MSNDDFQHKSLQRFYRDLCPSRINASIVQKRQGPAQSKKLSIDLIIVFMLLCFILEYTEFLPGFEDKMAKFSP
jgi:hypothetical protein